MDFMAWQTRRGKLKILMTNVADSNKSEKLADLYDYLSRIKPIWSIIKNGQLRTKLTQAK